MVPSTEQLEEDDLVPRRPGQEPESSGNLPPTLECPSQREERPFPLKNARMYPQQEPVATVAVEKPSELPEIAHAEPSLSANSPPGPACLPLGVERPLPPSSPAKTPPGAEQLSLSPYLPSRGTLPAGGRAACANEIACGNVSPGK